MRLKIFPWLEQEFVSLSWEGSGNGTVEDETRELMKNFADHLSKLGLSLDDVVRTRMFARDMDAWIRGNEERRRMLDGKARSVSSSHLWTGRLSAIWRIAIDLLAMELRVADLRHLHAAAALALEPRVSDAQVRLLEEVLGERRRLRARPLLVQDVACAGELLLARQQPHALNAPFGARHDAGQGDGVRGCNGVLSGSGHRGAQREVSVATTARIVTNKASYKPVGM
jgi:hypothetical protein